MDNPTKIHKAILGIIADIPAIGKDKHNTQQNFKYRGVDDVMNVLHPLLCKHGVYIIPEVLQQTREDRKSAKGNALIYSVCTMRFTFTADDGSSITAVTVGEGMDSGDKATNKAMAIALKYACFQVFCIPTEEMPDPDGESPEVAPKEPSKPATPTTPPPEPALCPACGKVSTRGGKEREDGSKPLTPAEFIAKAGMCPGCVLAAQKAARERQNGLEQAAS